jgi:two-component system response regulator CpxR
MSRILVVEDEAHLAEGLRFNLEQEGYSVQVTGNGEEALERLLKNKEVFDALVLDVMLPGKDGFTVARTLRETKNFIPLLMLTARSRPEDVLQGFESGADDYLPKPFDPDELLARVRAVLRRTEAARRPAGKNIAVGRIRVNGSTREVWSSGMPVDLTAMEFDLLELLMRSAGRVISRDEITATLFEREATPYDRFLDVHISHLRKKLAGGRGLIRTIRGVGYVFTGKK